MITQVLEKIKPFAHEHREMLGTLFLLIAIAIGSFFFGRTYGYQEALSGPNNVVPKVTGLDPLENSHGEIFGSTPTTTTQNEASGSGDREVETGQFIASVSGTKYYPASGCGAVNRIKAENRVYFASEEDAEAGGYERYSGCK